MTFENSTMWAEWDKVPRGDTGNEGPEDSRPTSPMGEDAVPRKVADIISPNRNISRVSGAESVKRSARW